MEDELAYKMHLGVSSESDDDHKENLDDEYEALKPPVRQFDCSDIIKVKPPSPENAWKRRQQQGTSSNTEQHTAAVDITCFSLPNLLDDNISLLSSSKKKKKRKQKNSPISANTASQASVISETKCDYSVTFTAPSKDSFIGKNSNDNMLKGHNELVTNDTVSTSTLKLSTYNIESSYLAPIQKNVANTSSTNNMFTACATQQTSSVSKKKRSRKKKKNDNLANTNNSNNLANVHVNGRELRDLTMQMLRKSINMAKTVIHLDQDESRQLLQDSFSTVRKIVLTEVAKEHPTKEALYDAITKTILKKGLIYRGFMLPVEIGENGHIQAGNTKLNKHQHSFVAHTTQKKPEQLSKHMDKLAKTVANNENMHAKKVAVMTNEGNTIKNEKKTAKRQIIMHTSTDEKDKILQPGQSFTAEGVNIRETSTIKHKPKISMECFEKLMRDEMRELGQNIKSTPKSIQKDVVFNIPVSNNTTHMAVPYNSTEGIQHSHNMDQSNLDSCQIFGDIFKEEGKKLGQLAPKSFNHPNQTHERETNTLGNSDFENLNINFEHNVGGITLISETDKVDVVTSSDVIPQNDNKNHVNGDDANAKKSKKKSKKKNKTPNLLNDLESLSEVSIAIKEKMATPPIIHIDVIPSILEASKYDVVNDEVLTNKTRRYSEKELLEINDLQKSKGYVLDNNIRIPESIAVNNNKKCKAPKLTKSRSTTATAVQTDIAIPPIEQFFIPLHKKRENLADDEDITFTSNENFVLTKEKNCHIDHETLFDKVINLVLIFVCVELLKSFLNNGLWIIFIFIFKFSMVLLAVLGFYKCLN